AYRARFSFLMPARPIIIEAVSVAAVAPDRPAPDRPAPDGCPVPWLVTTVPKAQNQRSRSRARLGRVEIDEGRQHRKTGGIVLMSSGTTGEPKRIALSESQLLHAAGSIAEHHRLSPADRGFCPLPLFHINAEVVGLLATLMSGACLVVDDRFHRTGFWSIMAETRVTWINAVPAIIARLADLGPDETVPAGIRFIRSASAPLAVATLERFEARTGIPVLETYGMTEAASQITANPLDGVRKPGSVGRPVGIELRIVPDPGLSRYGGRPSDAVGRPTGGDHGQSEDRLAFGQVEIRGPSVITAYADGRHGTRFDAAGWLRTGDIGHLDDDGYLYLDGRVDDVINRGGEKLFPREIEEVLSAAPEVTAAVVVAGDDPVFGQVPVAFVTVRAVTTASGADTLDPVADRLRTLLTTQLARTRRPSALFIVTDLPRGRTGKLSRRALQEWLVTRAPDGLGVLREVPLTDTAGAGAVLAAPVPATAAPVAGPTGGTRKRLDHIDAMRPVKQAGVVSTHVLLAFAAAGTGLAVGASLMLLHVTREAFLFVSACMLTYSYRVLSSVDLGPYVRRRFWSVGVPYLCWTVIYFLFTLPTTMTSWGSSLRHLGYLAATGYYQLYYLIVVAQFYVVFPLLFRLLRRTARRHGLVLALSAAVQVGYVSAMHWNVLPWWLQTFWATREITSYQFYLVAGMVVALHLDDVHQWLCDHAVEVVGFTVLSAGVAEAWYFLAADHVVAWFGTSADPFQPIVIPFNVGAIASIYLIGVALVDRRRPAWTRAVVRSGSDNAYGIYLAQTVFITVLGWLGWQHLDGVVPWPVLCGFTVVLVVLACVALTAVLARTPLARPLTGRSRVPWPPARRLHGTPGRVPGTPVPGLEANDPLEAPPVPA
ncbi:MAG: AMP-binding protein, partial [Acidimicrobiales bacterium]